MKVWSADAGSTLTWSFRLSPARKLSAVTVAPDPSVTVMDSGAYAEAMDAAALVKPSMVAVTRMVPPCRHVSVLPLTVPVLVSLLVNVTPLVVSRSPT